MKQKQQHIEHSGRWLALFTRNKQEFLRRYVIVNETCKAESNRQSAEWKATGESCPKRPKTQQSTRKVMTCVFLNAHGIIFNDYLENEKTVNSKYYIAILERLKADIAKKRLHMKK